MNFLKELTSNQTALSPVDSLKMNDRSSANLTLMNEGKDIEEYDEKFKNCFFQSSCTSWFEHLKELTFSSTFCTLLPEEANVIVNHWKVREQLRITHSQQGVSPELIAQAEEELYSEALSKLSSLRKRLTEALNVELTLSPVNKAFVKLTTRSPKDSKKALKRAENASKIRFSYIRKGDSSLNEDTMLANQRWRILSEEVTNACAVSNADEALELLLDSARVYEDLEFSIGGNDGELDHRLGLVARSWDPRLKPENEFRGICQNGELTCLCQYFHPLLFPEILEKKHEIQEDILKMMTKTEVKEAIKSVGNNCMIDFAWLGAGEVIIIEFNPFDGESLGIFPASTGLFIWDYPPDRDIMTGKAPFEFRCRTELLPKHKLVSQCNKDWVRIIYP